MIALILSFTLVYYGKYLLFGYILLVVFVNAIRRL